MVTIQIPGPITVEVGKAVYWPVGVFEADRGGNVKRKDGKPIPKAGIKLGLEVDQGSAKFSAQWRPEAAAVGGKPRPMDTTGNEGIVYLHIRGEREGEGSITVFVVVEQARAATVKVKVICGPTTQPR